GGGGAEGPLEVALAVEQLPADRLPSGQVAVGLDPLPAHELPAPGGDVGADTLEQLRVQLLDPLVVAGRAGREGEIGVLVEPVGGGGEGRDHFAQALAPVPDPDRVDVGVRYGQ